jgi:hypothetical protein
MTYSKPQLTELGDTNQLIQSTACPHAKRSCFGDSNDSLTAATAYEADE